MVTGSIGDKNTVNIIIEAAIKTKSLFRRTLCGLHQNHQTSQQSQVYCDPVLDVRTRSVTIVSDSGAPHCCQLGFDSLLPR